MPIALGELRSENKRKETTDGSRGMTEVNGNKRSLVLSEIVAQWDKREPSFGKGTGSTFV